MSNQTLTDKQRAFLARGKFIVGEDAYGLCLECEDGIPVFYDIAADILNAARDMDAEIERLKEDNARLRALVEQAYSEGYDNGLDSDYDWQNSYARKVLEGEGGE